MGLVCQREEIAGHPQECADADARARAAGGSLLDRIVTRTSLLPDTSSAQTSIRRVWRVIWASVGAIALVMLVVGCGAAARLLADPQVNLPITLLTLVGLNFATFVVWLVVQPFARRIVGLAGGLNRLAHWMLSHAAARGWNPPSSSAASPLDSSSTLDVLSVITAEGRGRWLFGCALHTIWLAFAIGSTLALTMLLSLKRYTLSWETTLLNEHALALVERIFSLGPVMLGIGGPESLPVTDTASASAGQYWSAWLLRAAIVYGIVPRLVAALVCASLFWRSVLRIGRDLSRPGFARLRSRLMPDSVVLPESNPDLVPRTPVPAGHLGKIVLKGDAHGIALDGAASTGAPALAAVHWKWLGQANDASSHTAALQRLKNESVSQLAVVLRAAMTPDRGVERRVSELKAASRATIILVLDDLDQLRKRGEASCRARLSQWFELAVRTGVDGVTSSTGEPIALDQWEPRS